MINYIIFSPHYVESIDDKIEKNIKNKIKICQR